MLVANFDDPKPIWNIHGHLHSPEHFHDNLPHCFQVSMESNNCYPISIDEIVELIKAHSLTEETVKELITEATLKIGEKISIRRFVRFERGEGLEKKEENFAEEVMKQIK